MVDDLVPTAFLLCPHMGTGPERERKWRGERGLSGISSYKDANPMGSGPHLYDLSRSIVSDSLRPGGL